MGKDKSGLDVLEDGNSVERCPVCGTALDSGVRKNEAKRAAEFINKAEKMWGKQELRLAASLYSCALELATAAGRPDIRAEALWGRGQCYEDLGERGIALLDYEDAHKIDPDDDAYLTSLAELRAALDHEKRLEGGDA